MRVKVFLGILVLIFMSVVQGTITKMAYGEVIHLKNGDEIQGSIQSLKSDYVVVKTPRTKLRVYCSDISSIDGLSYTAQQEYDKLNSWTNRTTYLVTQKNIFLVLLFRAIDKFVVFCIDKFNAVNPSGETIYRVKYKPGDPRSVRDKIDNKLLDQFQTEKSKGAKSLGVFDKLWVFYAAAYAIYCSILLFLGFHPVGILVNVICGIVNVLLSLYFPVSMIATLFVTVIGIVNLYFFYAKKWYMN